MSTDYAPTLCSTIHQLRCSAPLPSVLMLTSGANRLGEPRSRAVGALAAVAIAPQRRAT